MYSGSLFENIILGLNKTMDAFISAYVNVFSTLFLDQTFSELSMPDLLIVLSTIGFAIFIIFRWFSYLTNKTKCAGEKRKRRERLTNYVENLEHEDEMHIEH